MKLEDIRTIDELREFSSKGLYYTVRAEEVEEIVGELRFCFFLDGDIAWGHGDMGLGWFCIPLFDNQEEAERHALEEKYIRLRRELKECEDLLGHAPQNV